NPAASSAVGLCYREETDRALRRRLDLTVGLFLLFVGVSVVLEPSFHPERTTAILAAYTAQVFVCLLGLAGWHLTAVRPRLVGAAMSGVLALLLSWYTGAVAAPVERFATAQVCLLSGLVVLVPWGWGAQLFVSAASMLSMMLATAPGAEAESIAYAAL